MSIPPSAAVGTAITAAKLTARLASKVAQESGEVLGSFAEVLGRSDESASAETDVDSLPRILDDLIQKLGLSTEQPMELQVDAHGQIQVLPASGKDGTAADASDRARLQSHINGDDSLRQKISDLLR